MIGDEPKPFVPVTREDVTDEALLPRQVRFLAGQVGELLGVLRRQVIPKIDAIGDRLSALEQDSNEQRARTDALEDHINELRIMIGRPA